MSVATRVRYDRDKVAAAAEGKWPEILPALVPSFNPEHANGNGQPCPNCKDGDDRFNVGSDFSKTGSCFCRVCGLGGDGFSALMKMNRWTFTQALRAVAEFLNVDPEPSASKPADKQSNRSKAPSAETLQKMPTAFEERAIREGKLEGLAAELGVSARSLRETRTGWNGEAWTNPETDASGQVVGINQRFPDGVKRAYRGHKRGLMIADRGGSILYCVEGASDTAAVIDLGLSVIGRPSANGGADYLVELLRDDPRTLFILGENDAKPDGSWPGLAGAVSIARKLGEAGVDVQVALPADGAKDVRDWKAKFPDGDFVESLDTYSLDEAETLLKYTADEAAVLGGDNDEEELDGPGEVDPPREAEEVIQSSFTVDSKCSLVHYQDAFHAYDGQRWRQKDFGAIHQNVARHLAWKYQRIGQSQIANTIAYLKAWTYLPPSTPQNSWLHKDQGYRLAVKNGLINLDTWQLEPHSRDWFSPVALPVEFDPRARCNLWSRTLETNLEGDTERINILQEFAGYLLWPTLEYQKYLTLIGEGGNGKSVFIAGLQAMLGDENVSNYSIDYLGQNRFAPIGTIGKLANLCADISEVDRLAEGVLKQLVSGDTMACDRKNLPILNVRPTAKLVFSANNLPRFRDRSSGMTRRMIIVPFNRKVSPDEAIRGMDRPEFWECELPGILNWALEGLRRLRRRNAFSDSSVCNEQMESYRLDNNPAAAFIEEMLTVSEDPSAFLVKADVYRQYRIWCENHGRRPLSDAEFGRELKRAFEGLEEGRPRINGRRKRGYFGLRMYLEPQPI